jgi:octaprenyl-diphosphate synthase
MDPGRLERAVNAGLASVQNMLLEQSSCENRMIQDICHHVLKSGGKRVRSKFVLISHLIFNEELNDRAVSVATASEMFHTATLLHDDVMDQARIRRGQETVNSRWGSKTAVLLGDFLLSRTFKILRSVDSMEIMSGFIEIAQLLGEGALTEQFHKDDLNLSEETYYYIIQRKTAAFFSMCAISGAIISALDNPFKDNLKDFGFNFGMAFQITDDLMDVVSDESTMGKSRGQDILEGHLTLPLIRYFNQNKGSIPDKKLSLLTRDDDQFVKLIEGINSDGSLRYSYDKASEFIKEALRQLDSLPQGEAVEMFRQMTNDLLKRKA